MADADKTQPPWKAHLRLWLSELPYGIVLVLTLVGIAYSSLTLVVLNSAPVGSAGAASAALQLANVLGVALGTGLGGAILWMAAAHATQPLGIACVDATAVLAAGLGIVTARRL